MNPTRNDCSLIDEHLADYLGGELSMDLHEQFEAHVVGCAGCAAKVSGLRSARDLVQSSAGKPEHARHATAGLTSPNLRRSSGRMFGRLAIAASLLLAFLAGYLVGNPGRPAPSQPTGSSNVTSPPSRDESGLPRVARDYLNATRTRPHANSFGWALMSAARR